MYVSYWSKAPTPNSSSCSDCAIEFVSLPLGIDDEEFYVDPCVELVLD